MEAGDVYLADVGHERRLQVVVLSSGEFNRRAGRAFVAPQLDGPPQEVPPPWRISDGDCVYAVDFTLSLATTRLLERRDAVSGRTLRSIRQVLRRITS
jgi:mRNA-degrading endonuclease toxin of MazEF toxin-antitoxin module